MRVVNNKMFWKILSRKNNKKYWGIATVILISLGVFIWPASGKAKTENDKKGGEFENIQKIIAVNQNNNDRGGAAQTEFSLPPLPYEYNALEPYYDEKTLRLHHDQHHAGYVRGLNKALKNLDEARRSGDYSLIKHWEKDLAFHGSGHILHSLFWMNMVPGGGGTPKGDLAIQIARDFGSFDGFKNQFSEAAAAVEGSGWAMLGWMPDFNQLVILQIENHQKLIIPDIKPLLVLDVWEHAYYLKYQNRRGEWIRNWWNIVNWDDVTTRFSGARK